MAWIKWSGWEEMKGNSDESRISASGSLLENSFAQGWREEERWWGCYWCMNTLALTSSLPHQPHGKWWYRHTGSVFSPLTLIPWPGVSVSVKPWNKDQLPETSFSFFPFSSVRSFNCGYVLTSLIQIGSLMPFNCSYCWSRCFFFFYCFSSTLYSLESMYIFFNTTHFVSK